MHKTFHNYSKLVVKIGSESIGGHNEESNLKLEYLARDIAELKASTHWKVYVVTSGAVLHGKLALGMKLDTQTSDQEKQLLAAVGQGYLMKRWNDALGKHGLFGAQIMTTHGLLGPGNTTDTALIQSVRSGFLTSLEYIAEKPNIVPIINENDPVTPEEIKRMNKGADNDENAGRVAGLVKADHLAILTNTNGVWKNSEDPKSRIEVLHAKTLDDATIDRMTNSRRSTSGTGGMGSKLRVMRDAAHSAIGGYIYDGLSSTLIDFVNSKEVGSKLAGGTIIR